MPSPTCPGRSRPPRPPRTERPSAPRCRPCGGRLRRRLTPDSVIVNNLRSLFRSQFSSQGGGVNAQHDTVLPEPVTPEAVTPEAVTPEEYARRLAAVRERMASRSLAALFVGDPANIYYLTGYNAWSFYTPQVLVVPAEGDVH